MAEAGRQPPGASRPLSRIRVEVVYALPAEQVLLEIEVEEGTTVAEAIARSKILERFPEFRIDRDSLGIFGKIVTGDTPLRDGDRVEIYRPLIADPKQARLERAKKPAAKPRR